ncbi:hypothetical protein ANN_10973 [Periplaneta americana]|uniref:DUF4817 domain-containing protein n=1 Tax=Periplaneta americana TaxID=6978 RepID=A0ABQ8T597_PERAM|nr:hypothetical protein ANN_10973 [Periplaneta americana]
MQQDVVRELRTNTIDKRAKKAQPLVFTVERAEADSVNCCQYQHAECASEGDKSECRSYMRSPPAMTEQCQFEHREQMNVATGFLDASHLYGVTEKSMKELRTLEDGRIRLEGCPSFQEYCNRFPEKDFAATVNTYSKVNKSTLRTELEVLYSRVDLRAAEGAAALLQLFLRNNMQETFHECVRLLSIIVTIPMSTVESERSLPSKETLRGHSDSSFRGEGYIQCCVGVRLCDMYSNQELAEIHFMYGKANGNAALARRLYQERYPQRQCPDRKTFVRLHYRLCEYGKFNSPGLGRGRPRSTTPEVHEEILEAVNMTPSISTRRVALQVNVPHTTVWRVLKEYQLYPYHLQRVQALSSADYPARVRFCQWFLQQCGVNPNFPALVLFTDKAQLTRDGITNFHNQHVWAYENPRATIPSHHQVRFSLNMWAGIIGDRLVGPHVLVNRLTRQAYTNFLENTIPHVLEDTPLINRQHIHFLHDGAPAHFSRTALRYLDRRFPDRWIGRRGPIAWPPRSPDLNPLDFYLWGHLKSLVYSSPVSDLESLRNRIVACSEDIRNTPGVWDRVRR